MLRRRAVFAVVASTAGLFFGVGAAEAEVDDRFGHGGRWVVGGGYADRLVPLALPDGTVLAIGHESGQNPPAGDHGPKRSVLRVDRLDAAGNLVPFTAQDDGALKVDVRDRPGFDDMVEPAGVVRRPDGRLVVQSPSPRGSHLIGLTPSGHLDPSFGGDGFVGDDFSACRGVVDLVLLGDGSLVGVAHGADCQGTTLRRYDTSGNRVAPWGNAARDGTAFDGRLHGGSLAAAGADRFVVAGSTSDGGAVAVARYRADGTPDPGFGSAGLATFDPDPARAALPLAEPGFHPQTLSTTYATDVAVDGQGRVLVVGGSTTGTDGGVDQWVARLLPSGALDPAFGSGGITWWRSPGTRDIAFAVALDSVGRIVVSGSSTPEAGARHWHQTTFRLLPDGAFDPTVTPTRTAYGSSWGTVGIDQSLAGDGRVYVGGDTFYEYGTKGYIGAVDLGGGPAPTTTTPPTSTPPTSTPPTTTPPTTTTAPTSTTQPPTTTPPGLPPAGTSGFTAVTPTRLLDTRLAHQGPAVGAGADREVALGGVVPTEAVAVAVNLTVTEGTAPAFASAFPAGTPWPGTSTVNYEPGQTVANSVVVPTGALHRLALRVGAGTAHLVVDLQGWYTADGFTGTQPDRQFDSRLAGGPLGDQPVHLRLRDVPDGATAVAVNLTVTGADRDSYLVAWAGGSPEPHASLVNHRPGVTVANGVIVPLGPGGTLDLRNASGHVHVVVDVMGWVTGTGYTPVAPERVVDTRLGLGGPTLGPGTARTFTVAPRGVDPATVGAVVVNVTITRPTSTTYLTAWPAGSPRPLASVVNAAPDQTIANGLVLGVAAGQLQVFNGVGSADVVIDVVGWYPGS